MKKQTNNTVPPVPLARLVLCLLRFARECFVVALVATILVVSFRMVIDHPDRPWWAHILAWLAVWSTYDIYKLRKSPQNAEVCQPEGGKTL